MCGVAISTKHQVGSTFNISFNCREQLRCYNNSYVTMVNGLSLYSCKGGLMSAKERLSGVDIVHGCFLKEGNTIQSACLLLGALASDAAGLASYSRDSLAGWYTKSHDQPECAHALWCLCYDVTSNWCCCARSERAKQAHSLYYRFVCLSVCLYWAVSGNGSDPQKQTAVYTSVHWARTLRSLRISFMHDTS